MTKLTTELLEKFVSDIKTDGMCDITDHQVALALRQLLAYEQAAKNEVALPEALKYAEIYGRSFICVDRSGSVHAVDPSQITLTILNEPAPAQPVSEPYKLPSGWMLVPIEPTENMIIDGFESEPDKTFSKPEVWEEYAAMSGCKQAAHRAKLCWAAMLAAAPAQESE